MNRIIKYFMVVLSCMLLFNMFGCGNKDIVKPEQHKQAYLGNEIRYADELWNEPKTYSFEEIMGKPDNLSDQNVKAVFLKGVDYEGGETRIFGYLGIPDTASETNKAPAVLLIHGGGGTAYKEWVKFWVESGYVAFAIDYQGNMPRLDCTIDTQKYDEIPNFHAPKNVNFDDAKKAIENQWMYWVTSSAIISNSYLRSLKFVDSDKVGICGLSWGSMVTSIVIGYDDRFAFASDIYGCMYNSEHNTYMKDNFVRNPDALIWDDIQPFQATKVPVHVSYYIQDTNFTLNAISKTLLAKPSMTLSIQQSWWHAHGGAFAVKEPIAFANSQVKGSSQLIKIVEQPTKANDLVDYEVPYGVSVKKIELFYTTSVVLNGATVWKSVTLNNAIQLSSHVPENTKYLFVTITDSNDLKVSSALCKR